MGKYYNQLNEEQKEYFKILSPEYPEWIEEYIDTKEMTRIGKISISCGMDYSSCFNIKYFYSNLDHSVGVALIIWNFTHDKKQTLAGLFHDIATPVFKHCIDFMNGDSENQESTEERTLEILENSEEIISLLKRDNIKLEEVVDYKLYPIADNETPKLSADRFEYTFSSGLTFYRIWELDSIKKIYENIVVLKNENNIDELGFKDKEVCEEYIKTISEIWPEWISDNDRTVMQFIADMCKIANKKGFLEIDDLYTLSEEEVVKIFENCEDDYIRNAWKKFQKCKKANKSETYIDGKYCINVKSKARYIVPLVKLEDSIERITEVSHESKQLVKRYISLPKGGYYTYFDFHFEV